jgi:hypothetical protein
MTNDQNASPEIPDDRLDTRIASIWVLILGSLVVIEIGSLILSYSMLAAALH